MAHPDQMGTDVIRFERVYDATLEDVWALWTTRDGFEQWFAPEGMRVEVSVLDLRVGGALVHEMRAVGEEQRAYFARVNRSPVAEVSGRFIEIVPHQRLRIRFDIDFVPGVASYPYDMLVELHVDDDARVRMVLTVDRHPDPEMTRGAVLALDSQLQRFGLAVAQRARTER